MLLPRFKALFRCYSAAANPVRSLRVGDTHELSRTFGEEELAAFGKISLDYNPLHFNEEYAKKTRFGRRILHGHLVTSLFSGILGVHLPGEGSVYLSQTFQYIAPVFLNDTVIAQVKVLEISKSRAIVTMETTIRKESDGKYCVKGEAKVLVPREYIESE